MDELKLTAAKIIVKKAVDIFSDRAQAFLSRSEAMLTTPDKVLTEALDAHQNEIKQWAGEISFRDMSGQKRLEDIYVPLNVYLSQRRSRLASTEALSSVGMDELLARSGSHTVILGQPGAGKTTSIKHVCRAFLGDPAFLSSFQRVVLIRLRDLNNRPLKAANQPALILDKVQDLLRIKITYPVDIQTPEDAPIRTLIRDRLVIEWLNKMKVLILLDGFDELAAKNKREGVIDELRRLSPQLTSARCVLTTRTGEFNYHLEGFEAFEIEPLSEAQILQLATYWLGKRSAKQLVTQIQNSPFSDTALRPLTIAHLCAIFERTKKIPEKPKTVYRKVISLLLEEWDEQRSVKRQSAYGNFDSDRKAEFLSNLAYVLTASFYRTSFTRDELVSAYMKIRENFKLPEKDADKVVSELESHTGLLLRAGFESFEFSHKSLQEYLAADYIVKLPSIPRRNLATIPNELAIAIAISSRPSEYFTQLITQHLSKQKLSFTFVRAFVNRLILERPDFEISAFVGYAFLRLYSQYVNSYIQLDEQLEFFLFDQLSVEFDTLADYIRARLNLRDILAQYKQGQTAHTLEGSPVLSLELDISSPDYRRRLAEGLPEQLWIRDSLLAEGPKLEQVLSGENCRTKGAQRVRSKSERSTQQ